MHNEPSNVPRNPDGSALEVFLAFLKLGLTSFGGPIAHLGYFHRELIERRKWVDESEYAQFQPDGRTTLPLTPLELIHCLAQLLPPPRKHRHL